MPLQLAFIGNFEPRDSSENDWRRTLEAMGHTVTQFQEQDPALWQGLTDNVADFDIVLWTRTAGLAAQIPMDVQRRMQMAARKADVPTVGYHLDRWWGLDRESSVLTEPWFQCQWVFTADGGHQEDFTDAGVNHHWMPPATSPFNAIQGAYREDFAHEIVFVGSWQGGYHVEWQHRPQMIDQLRNTYGERLGLFPQPTQGGVRGPDLADLYASCTVAVGDSCLVPKSDGSPMTDYCSDRVFETVGRAGYLIHPNVEGCVGPDPEDLMTPGVHLGSWDLWDWTEMHAQIQWALDNPTDARDVALAGQAHIQANHTYTNRFQAVLDLVVP